MLVVQILKNGKTKLIKNVITMKILTTRITSIFMKMKKIGQVGNCFFLIPKMAYQIFSKCLQNLEFLLLLFCFILLNIFEIFKILIHIIYLLLFYLLQCVLEVQVILMVDLYSVYWNFFTVKILLMRLNLKKTNISNSPINKHH